MEGSVGRFRWWPSMVCHRMNRSTAIPICLSRPSRFSLRRLFNEAHQQTQIAGALFTLFSHNSYNDDESASNLFRISLMAALMDARSLLHYCFLFVCLFISFPQVFFLALYSFDPLLIILSITWETVQRSFVFYISFVLFRYHRDHF